MISLNKSYDTPSLDVVIPKSAFSKLFGKVSIC